MKKEGSPHLWRGHTHTTPPAGASPVYIGRYSLPKLKGIQIWAPCPCCHPNSLQYFREGRIAWFQDEHVIRNMGDKCYRRLNPEGHDQAEAGLRSREKEERRRAYLLDNLGTVPATIAVAAETLPVAKALENARRILRTRFDQLLPVDFWSLVRSGHVQIDRRTRVHTGTNRTGDDDNDQYTIIPEAYGPPIQGYMIARFPGPRSLTAALERSVLALQQIDFGESHKQRIEEMTSPYRIETERLFGKARGEITRCQSVIRDELSFFSTMNIATLKGWCLHPDCPVSLFIDVEDRTLILGRDAATASRVKLPDEIWSRLPALPELR